MPTFAITGACGYIAKKHLHAVKETGNTLIAGYDPAGSSDTFRTFFPDTPFFTDEELFKAYLQKTVPDYFIVCSPTHLHKAHATCALEQGMDVICEKPLTLHPEEITYLRKKERETGKRIFTILQLRLLQSMQKLKASPPKPATIDLTYTTSRDARYFTSWKGDEKKSGGVLLNFGIHLFDLLLWIYGTPTSFSVQEKSTKRVRGTLSFEQVTITWIFTLDAKRGKSKRLFTINGQVIDLVDYNNTLHLQSYRNILQRRGIRTEELFPVTELIEKMRK